MQGRLPRLITVALLLLPPPTWTQADERRRPGSESARHPTSVHDSRPKHPPARRRIGVTPDLPLDLSPRPRVPRYHTGRRDWTDQPMRQRPRGRSRLDARDHRPHPDRAVGADHGRYPRGRYRGDGRGRR